MTPSLRALIVRGCGWGALLGGAAGFFVLPIAALVSEPGWWVLLLLIPYGAISAIIGAAYGAVAGTAVAAAVRPAVRRAAGERVIRVIAVVVGALVVVGLSTVLFRPSFTPGPNETSSHVRDDMILFYAIPGVMAIVAAAIFSPRLLVPRRASEAADETLE